MSRKVERLLPDIYKAARMAEALLSNPDTPDEIRAQLELALLEAAAEEGVSIISPELSRAAFLEIFKSTAEGRVPETTYHHYGKPSIRLLTLLDCVAYDGSSLRRIKLHEGDCREGHAMLQDFIERADRTKQARR
jgi:hypothetical protein